MNSSSEPHTMKKNLVHFLIGAISFSHKTLSNQAVQVHKQAML